ncbi:hypothetical protein [Streptomyces sp. CAU 1734]
MTRHAFLTAHSADADAPKAAVFSPADDSAAVAALPAGLAPAAESRG